jgi:3-oxoacyl-[acyl-carrier protein] reductase
MLKLTMLASAVSTVCGFQTRLFSTGMRSVATRAAMSPTMAADGPVCIVTGGSRGLGRSIALALGGEGCRVVVNYANSAAAAEAVVEEIKALGGEGVAIQADMSSTDGIKSLFKATAEAYSDPVGVLVNNAGITRDTLVLRMKESQWNDVINTNLNGVFFASQAASKVMMKKREGRIINVASVVGKIGNVGQANYAAAKGGVIAMTMSMARECAARGVTVNAIAPGFIESDMTAGARDPLLTPLPPPSTRTARPHPHSCRPLSLPSSDCTPHVPSHLPAHRRHQNCPRISSPT